MEKVPWNTHHVSFIFCVFWLLSNADQALLNKYQLWVLSIKELLFTESHELLIINNS